jgi:hypothetical protein
MGTKRRRVILRLVCAVVMAMVRRRLRDILITERRDGTVKAYIP